MQIYLRKNLNKNHRKLAYIEKIPYLCKRKSIDMPNTRLATLRYQALDRCFSDRMKYYFIEDLIKAVNHTLEENGQTPVSRRTVFNDIGDMVGNHDWRVLFEEPGKINGRRYYRYEDPDYSIWKNDLNQYQVAQLKSMLLMLQQFRGMPQYERLLEVIEQLEKKYNFELEDTEQVIAFDTNEYVEGIEYLSPLFEAIVAKQPQTIVYQPFGKESLTRVLHPYFIKQYNGRWFVFGYCKDGSYEGIINLALDRILSIEKAACKFVENEAIDFDEYFSDIIGVTLPREGDVEDIVLRFTPNRLPYVLSKPLHESQRHTEADGDCIRLRLIPNKEFYQKVLSFGKDVEVVSPQSVRDEIKKIITEMQQKY